MNIIFRKLKQNEAKKYRKIRLEALKEFPDSFGADYKDQSKLEKLLFEKILEENSKKGIIFGVFHNNNLIGISAIISEETILTDTAKIVQVFIKKSYQGKGIGKKMINSLIVFCKETGIKKIVLGVKINNHSAIKLYESLGFIKTNDYSKDDSIYYDFKL